MDWLTLVTAFGFGSIVTAGVQWWLARRSQESDRRFRERKEASIGLAEAWLRQEREDFPAGSDLEVGHWVLRVEFVASSRVLVPLRRWQATGPGTPERANATRVLKAAMRDDLA